MLREPARCRFFARTSIDPVTWTPVSVTAPLLATSTPEPRRTELLTSATVAIDRLVTTRIDVVVADSECTRAWPRFGPDRPVMQTSLR